MKPVRTHHRLMSLDILSVMALLFFLSSCSSILNGSHEDITIISNPPGASITVDGLSGTGTMVVPLSRGKQHIIEVQKAGYVTSRYTTGNNTTGWYFGNLIIGGLLGELIDIVTGAAYSVAPNPIVITLDKGSGPAQQIVSNESGTIGIVLGIVADLALVALLLL